MVTLDECFFLEVLRVLFVGRLREERFPAKCVLVEGPEEFDELEEEELEEEDDELEEEEDCEVVVEDDKDTRALLIASQTNFLFDKLIFENISATLRAEIKLRSDNERTPANES